tara:strand:- start:3541 stop:3732 length:192 start_codon:yes stop_codon:yes gene_type:complete
MGHLTDIIDWIRSKTTTLSVDTSESSTDFGSLTVSELKEIAKERGLKGYSSLRKADLVNLLSS